MFEMVWKSVMQQKILIVLLFTQGERALIYHLPSSIPMSFKRHGSLFSSPLSLIVSSNQGIWREETQL
jgi:hypothetical protein